jgi:hypothetical protein
VEPTQCYSQNHTDPLVIPTRLGAPVTFIWNARADAAISDDARIRIVMAQSSATAATNRARAVAVSPPFRVRATSCLWPQDATISPVTVPRGIPQEFVAYAQASGLVAFDWDFGNGVLARGQRVSHTFPHDGVYPVRLTVRGQPCPTTRPLATTVMVKVGTGLFSLYLPVVQGGGGSATAAGRQEEEAPAAPDLPPAADEQIEVVAPLQVGQPPPPVTDLAGLIRPDSTILTWNLPADRVQVAGHRVYRSLGGEFVRLARLGATAASYRDPGVTCGAAYFVTTFGPGGESPASTQTFYTLPCEGAD